MPVLRPPQSLFDDSDAKRARPLQIVECSERMDTPNVACSHLDSLENAQLCNEYRALGFRVDTWLPTSRVKSSDTPLAMDPLFCRVRDAVSQLPVRLHNSMEQLVHESFPEYNDFSLLEFVYMELLQTRHAQEAEFLLQLGLDLIEGFLVSGS